MKNIIFTLLLGTTLTSTSAFGMDPDGPEILERKIYLHTRGTLDQTSDPVSRQQCLKKWEEGECGLHPQKFIHIPNKFGLIYDALNFVEGDKVSSFAEGDKDSIRLSSLIVRAIFERPEKNFPERAAKYFSNEEKFYAVDYEFTNPYSPFIQYDSQLVFRPLNDKWQYWHDGVKISISPIKDCEEEESSSDDF